MLLQEFWLNAEEERAALIAVNSSGEYVALVLLGLLSVGQAVGSLSGSWH